MNSRLGRDATAVALLLGAVLLVVALLSHSPLDPSPFHVSTHRAAPSNLAGWLGATLSAALVALLGVPVLLLPILAAILGWRLLRHHDLARLRVVAAGWFLLLIGLTGFSHLLGGELSYRGGVIAYGGFVGKALAELLDGFAGPVGRVVVLSFLLVIGILMVSGVSAGAATDGTLDRLRRRLDARRQRRAAKRREKEREKDRRRVLQRQLDRIEQSDGYQGSVTVKEVEGKGRFRVVRRVTEAQLEASPDPAEVQRERPSLPRRSAALSAKPRPEPATPEPVVQEEFDFVEELGGYDLPQTGFLDQQDAAPERDSAKLIEISKLISDKCNEFRVRGEVVNIRTGPVITTYEYRLDSGVKISAVQNLAEDLALALRTEAVRIERIPGRATVGIEVPSPTPEVIRLRQLLESPEFISSSSMLTLSMGVDIRGKPFFADLARMPHLLMGGFTGAGKSVGINAMIMSILYKARPDEVKFIFVDPKMVELGVYSDIPHLLTPIITNPKKAANALGWAVAEMDNRYRRLASLGVRNLAQYNQLVKDPSQLRRAREQYTVDEDDDLDIELEPLPFIVIIIDELADLMMTSGRAVEESITRLAQKARAVGVHLICATQRPSVDILTGIIKANFPCRVAYKVRSKFDSRTILDVVGAEHLLGRGDMLFLPPGTSTLLRLHGPLVTEKEIATVVRYIKRLGKPEYLREVVNHAPLADSSRSGRKSMPLEEGEELTDPMYDQAARVVVSTRKASASFIQRRLHLGYTRSARLIDMMEKEGLVGPLDGSKGRQVLVPENYFGEVDETLALNGDDD